MEQIGLIAALDGRVTAVDKAGNARVLRQGDAVHRDATLVTALDASVIVRFVHGGELCLEPGRLIVLDADVIGDGVDEGAVRVADLELVLAWPMNEMRSSAA
jgi:diaminopimelate decarboxylase